MTERTVPFLATARKKYRRYSAHILGFRHFSEYKDGLKPVQRRAIWSAHELAATSKSKMVKSASVVGHAFGYYHPHEQSSIYGALSKMTQAHNLSPLVIGVGNWGKHNSGPAAERYTSCYLSPYAATMLDKSELACVPMDPSYDGKHKEPRFLPARLPHLLLAGCSSLASGYNGNIPPSTSDWVLESLHRTVVGRLLSSPRSMAYRWGGRMLAIERDWIKTGAGSAAFTPKFEIEGNELIFKSLAPGLGFSAIERKLERFDGFAGMASESPQGDDPVRIVARVRRGNRVADLEQYTKKHCISREHYSFLHISMVADENGDVTYYPTIEGPSAFLQRWVKWRRGIIGAAAAYRASLHVAEARRLELMIRAVDMRRELLKILDQSSDRNDLRRRTKLLLRCTDDEATMIMSLPWARLAKLERTELLAARARELAEAKREEGIAARPGPRLLPEAETAAQALIQTAAEAASMRVKSERRGRR